MGEERSRVVDVGRWRREGGGELGLEFSDSLVLELHLFTLRL